jgi:fatty-acyl-CoA synthase
MKKGDCVALMMDNRPEFIFIWLGLAKIGSAFFPLPISFSLLGSLFCLLFFSVVSSLINTNIKGKPLLHSLQVCAASHFVVGLSLVSFASPSFPFSSLLGLLCCFDLNRR